MGIASEFPRTRNQTQAKKTIRLSVFIHSMLRVREIRS